MKEFDAYIFDYDGTLFDSLDAVVNLYEVSFASIGIKISKEEGRRYAHLHPVQVLEERKIGKEQIDIFSKAMIDALDSAESIKRNVPFKETLQLFASLNRLHKPFAIVSGNTKKHIDLVLDYWKIQNRPNVIIGSDLYTHPKPSPEPLQIALNQMGLNPSLSICYVGDSWVDIEAGKAAGLTTIFIDRVGSDCRDLTPDFRIFSLFDLLENKK